MTYLEALDALDALYASLPIVPCQQRCQRSCGLIVMTKLEWTRILRKVGYQPHGKMDCVCPLLKQGKCSVHALRPAICRLYGSLDDSKMHCPYGCVPERILTQQESEHIFATIQQISETIFPHTPLAVFAHRLPLDSVENYIQRARALGKL